MRKSYSLKAFLLKKSTLIGWSAFLIISIMFLILVNKWSFVKSIYFVTLYGPLSDDPESTSEIALQIIAMFYTLGNFLVYTFNLYKPFKKYVLDFFHKYKDL